jgi:putative tryptophan/tyrosine transport system substrate-binding protein
MRRREFIAAFGGAVFAWPLAASAQQIMRPVVGFLNSASADNYAHLAAAFRQGLSDLGFVDGQNITIEYRWAAGQYDRLSEMAADLVRRGAAVMAVNTPALMPAKKATSTIPIVFFTAADPVEAGFVASLSRPGGNLTGAARIRCCGSGKARPEGNVTGTTVMTLPTGSIATANSRSSLIREDAQQKQPSTD